MNLLPLAILAKFCCLACGHEWEQPPKPTKCPKCDHLYVKWLNYEELRASSAKGHSRNSAQQGDKQ